MSFLDDLKQVGTTGAKTGAKVSVLTVEDALRASPGGGFLTNAIEQIDQSSAESHQKAAAKAFIELAQSTPIIAATSSEHVAPLDSKRFVSLGLGILTVVVLQGCVKFLALPQDVALTMIRDVWIGVVGYMVLETARPSKP